MKLTLALIVTAAAVFSKAAPAVETNARPEKRNVSLNIKKYDSSSQFQ